MADSKISQLGAGTPAQLTDTLPIKRGAGNNSLTIADILALSFHRNYIHNPSFDVAQRITSGALSTAYGYTSVDRWGVIQAGVANGIAAQVAPPGGRTGFKNCLKIGRNAGAVTTGNIAVAQVMETIDAVKLAGQNVVLSFDALAGANFSAAGALITILLQYGTGTDQSLASYGAGTWTGQTQLINTAQAIGAWARYQKTVAVPAGATQIGVTIFYTPTGTAGADDNLYLTGVKLEEGAIATPFLGRDINEELRTCQRYYEKSYNQGVAAGATLQNAGQSFFPATSAVPNGNVYGYVAYKVTKRAAPTVLPLSYTASSVAVASTAAGTDLASNSATVASSGDSGFQLTNGSGGSITPASGGFWVHWIVSADL